MEHKYAYTKQFSILPSRWKPFEKVIKKYNLTQFDDGDLEVGDFILQLDVDDTKPVEITKVEGDSYWVKGGNYLGYYWDDNDNYGVKASNKQSSTEIPEISIKEFSSKEFKVQPDDLISYLLHIMKQASGSREARKALCTAITIQGTRCKMPENLVNYLYDKVVS